MLSCYIIVTANTSSIASPLPLVIVHQLHTLRSLVFRYSSKGAPEVASDDGGYKNTDVLYRETRMFVQLCVMFEQTS